MRILLTGGLGYIGTHSVVELLQNNHEVIIVDNLYNSKIDVIDKIYDITGKKPIFYEIDATNYNDLAIVFRDYKLDGVIHFAGKKSIAESVQYPLDYYYTNLVSTISICRLCIDYGVNKFVFSSSATVYGDQPSPLTEELELKKTTNPYGETKVIGERILEDVSKANPEFEVSILRYFNPIGAHVSGLIGEDTKYSPNNLLPLVTKVAKGTLDKLRVFGDDYPTIDGTGIRDYIHVVDLAKGHVKAIENLKQGFHIYNLGTGCGTSVLELVNSFSTINKVEVPYEVVGRRPGDIATCYADPTRAEKELGWKAKLGLDDMVKDAWRFEWRK
ncbi:UDP-glucose 4-epimerase GalE [Paenibacillus sp. Marseille-Q9583]